MSVLVTGGAGYIGSVTVELLRSQGEEVIVLDNLSRGHRAAVAPEVTFYQGDVGDRELVSRICRDHGVDACVHFAAFAYVGESVPHPDRYYRNNTEQSLGLFDGLLSGGVQRVVFSSTCATYGEPVRMPIDEEHPQQPTNPYGWSKLFVERILHDYDHAYGLKFVALRYFNACGATPTRGEHHDPEPHLIPLVLQAARGVRPHISVFGTDYPTPDGTAIRDYIHVSDLGQAHSQGLAYLRAGGESTKINLGNGSGYSVLEVIDTARQVTGHPIEVKLEPRRPGDPSRLIAVADKAKRVPGWNPEYPELDVSIRSAGDWHEAHPNGYED